MGGLGLHWWLLQKSNNRLLRCSNDNRSWLLNKGQQGQSMDHSCRYRLHLFSSSNRWLKHNTHHSPVVGWVAVSSPLPKRTPGGCEVVRSAPACDELSVANRRARSSIISSTPTTNKLVTDQLKGWLWSKLQHRLLAPGLSGQLLCLPSISRPHRGRLKEERLPSAVTRRRRRRRRMKILLTST